MDARFTPAHRSGTGPPLVLLHGFTGSWRVWDRVLLALEREHEVLAPTLPGHAGGPPLAGELSHATVPDGDESYKGMLRDYAAIHEAAKAAAPHAEAVAATPQGRRQATEWIATNGEQIPPAVVADLIRATAGCDGAPAMIDYALREPWPLDADRIACPVRIVWGTEDRLLPRPSAAARYRRELHADWVELDGVGHCPQLDVPVETAQLILGFTAS